MGKDYYANIIQKKTEVTILISDKAIGRYRGGHNLKIKS